MKNDQLLSMRAYYALLICFFLILLGVGRALSQSAAASWTWEGGNPGQSGQGVYGIMGVSDPGNNPGVKSGAVSWTDASGTLWLFGGYGLDANGSNGYLNDLWKYNGANWTWVSGSDAIEAKGTYGDQGTAAPDNVPGARRNAVSWTGTSGVMWLFGGSGSDASGSYGLLNDLWKYDGTNWTWVSGSNTVNASGTYGTKGTVASTNVPRAREDAVSWTDASGGLWLFGGYGLDVNGSYGRLNDLWKYEGGNWTWVSGSDTFNASGSYGTQGIPAADNVPGARRDAVSWTDASGVMWLFGGNGYDANDNYSGSLNDLWKYNTTKNEWTWVSGSDIKDAPGTYGTLGTAAPANVPGARRGAVSWTDSSGVMWLFGGNGYDASGSYGPLNDLWKYAGTHWTWVDGSNTKNAPGNYGTQGTAASTNFSGARSDAVSWRDVSGVLWLFGGNGYDANGGQGNLNDLWKYDRTNWTWVSGSNTVNIPGTYGTRGTAASANVPGARYDAVSWRGVSGVLWLFGGEGYDASGGNGLLNDLWKYNGGEWTWVSGSNTIDAPGSYGTKGIPASANVPGGRYGAVSWTDASGVLWLFGGFGYGANGHSGSLNDLWKYDGTNWTWVSGSDAGGASAIYGTKGMAAPNNVPGARTDAVSWTDASGVLWLFGGNGYDASGGYGSLNDLWKYDETYWTWVSGSDAAGAFGIYGTQGTAAPDNVPGAKYSAVSWTDASGVLWLFGGEGRDANGSPGFLNDLWKYDISENNWTWVSGSHTVNASDNYGELNTAAPDNVPGARAHAVSWTDVSGGLWLFGGNRYSYPSDDYLNDLWKYDGTHWTWVSGSDAANAPGNYGTQGTAVPGARYNAVSWKDSSGGLWLFGGGNSPNSWLNDLWKLQVENGPVFISTAIPSVPENTAAIDVNAHNGDGGSTDSGITYSLSGADAEKFNINSASGVLTFKAVPNYEMPADTGKDNVYNVTVTANDGTFTATQSLTITVIEVNEVPVFTSTVTTATKPENTPITETVLDADANNGDGGTTEEDIMYTLSGADVEKFNLSSTGVITFTTAPDFEKPSDKDTNNVYNVTVTAKDDEGLTAEQSLTITVTNVNDNTPAFTSEAQPSVAENTTAVVTLAATDADAGATLTFSITGGADMGLFTLSGADLSFTTAPNFETPGSTASSNVYQVMVMASDKTNSTVQDLTITVTDANEAPTFTSTAAPLVAENTTAVVTLAATDADADATLTFSITGGADQSLFILNGADLSFKAAPDFEAPGSTASSNVYKVTVTADDGTNSTTQEMTITVTNTNDNVPTFTSSAQPSVVENTTTAVVTLAATDADAGATLTFSITGGADQSLFTLNGADLSFTTAPDYEIPGSTANSNVYKVTVTADDGTNSTTQEMTITVTNTNDNAPTFTSSAQPSVVENTTTAVVTLAATDADAGAALTFSMSGGADQSLFILNGADLSFKAAPDYEIPGSTANSNVYQVMVTVSDGPNSTTQDMTITVTDVNDNTPAFTSTAAPSVAENAKAVITLTATDADAGAVLTFSITGGADQSLFTLNGADLSFKAAPDFEASGSTASSNVYQVMVTADDGTNSTTQEMTITVTNTNDNAPTFTSTAEPLVAENTTAVVTLAATDADAGAALTFSITGGADQSLFILNGADLSFKAAPDYEIPGSTASSNVYKVTVTADDGTNSTTQEMAITVTDVNDNTPVFASDDKPSVAENAKAVITLAATDADAGAILTFSITGGADQGLFILSGADLSFKAAPDFEAPGSAASSNVYQVMVTASDGTNSTTQDITITVTNVNDNVPVLTLAANTILSEYSLAGTLVATAAATDADGVIADAAPLVWSLTAGNTDVDKDQTLPFAIDAKGDITVGDTEDLIASAGQFRLQITVSDGLHKANDTLDITLESGIPEATAATDTEYFRFTANWKAKAGAGAYQIDVATDDQFAHLLQGYDKRDETNNSVVVESAEVYYGSTYYYRVRALYGGERTSDYSQTIKVRTLSDPGTKSDSLALLTLYDSTGGPLWSRPANWHDGQPLRLWTDVKMTGTRVTSLTLGTNNLTGSMPTSMTGLAELQHLAVDHNRLSYIPNLSGLSSLEKLDISHNKVGFGSIEPHLQVNGFVYTPQGRYGEPLDTLHSAGEAFTFLFEVDGTANSYQWFKDQVKLEGATGKELALTTTTESSAGSYHAEVTNARVSGLTLLTEAYVLRISSRKRDSLVLALIYETTGGEKWLRKANWLTGSLPQWEGVKLTDAGRVSELSLPGNRVTGPLPEALKDLGELTVLNLSNTSETFNPAVDNQVTYLPHLGSQPGLTKVDMTRNRLDFASIEPNFLTLGSKFSFSPQLRIGTTTYDSVYVGSRYQVTIEAGGANNQYQWFKDSVKLEGATGKTYTIGQASFETMGSYYAEVTNPKVPGFALRNRNQNVWTVADVKGMITEGGAPLTKGSVSLYKIQAGPYDSTATVATASGGYVAGKIVLGDYVILARPDREAHPKALQSYYKKKGSTSTLDWLEADTLKLRTNIEGLNIPLLSIPPPLSGDGVITGTLETDLPVDSLADEESRVLARNRVRGSGVTLSRQVPRGRGLEDKFDYEFVAYTETDEAGVFSLGTLPDGTYKINIQYPGVPMDKSTDILLTLGEDTDLDKVTVGVLVTKEGIKVEQLKVQGLPAPYIRDLTVYPNPGVGEVTVDYFVRRRTGGLVLKVADVTGNTLQVMQLPHSRGTQRAVLNVTNLASGIYMLSITDQASRFIETLRLEKK